MKLLFFPKYTPKGASSRYRTYQYLPYFKEFECDVFPFFDDNYKPSQSFKSINNLFYVIYCYSRRALNIFRIKKNDLVFLEYEFMPYLPFFALFFKLFKINYIVDYDDAIFHNYDLNPNKIVRYILKNKIKNVIKNANTVITGSPYLTTYAKRYNTNVIEIPTSINFEKYQANNKKASSSKFVIGWIGSKTTSVNLISLIPAFQNFKKWFNNFEIRCIGFDTSLEHHFKNLPFKIIQWNFETEVEEINNFSVGIMPLENTPFNKGKCAFKLIQYMACGIPTISTPLEANIKVNRDNNNIFANSTQEWTDAFIKTYKPPVDLQTIGERNKKLVETYYTAQANKELYLKVFKSIIEKQTTIKEV